LLALERRPSRQLEAAQNLAAGLRLLARRRQQLAHDGVRDTVQLTIAD
jgi:hypothetical protein